MAYTNTNSFSSQIQYLTDISADNNIIVGFLVDGVKDTVHKLSKVDPMKLYLFASTGDLINENGFYISNGLVLGVRRNTGETLSGTAIKDYRPSERIGLNSIQRVQDQNSLEYRSKYNPVFYVENNSSTLEGPRIYILPPPTATQDAKISYVQFSNLGRSGDGAWTSLSSAHNQIQYVPDQYITPVVLYAAKRVIEWRISELGNTEEDIELMQALSPIGQRLSTEYNEYFLLGAQRAPATQEGGEQQPRGER